MVVVASTAFRPTCTASSRAKPPTSRHTTLRSVYAHSLAEAQTRQPLFSGDWNCTLNEQLARPCGQDSYTLSARSAQLLAPSRRVQDVMQENVEFIYSHTSLSVAAARLQSMDSLAVIDAGFRLLGLLLARDLHRPGTTVEHLLRPAVSVSLMDELADVAALMQEKGLGRLPVVDGDGRVVGSISRTSLFWCLAQETDHVRPH